MALKADGEVSIALATSVMAYGAYQLALPSTADIRSLEPGNADVQGSERAAAWISAVLVSAVALITKSPSVFILGGATVVASSWLTRHADAVKPVTQKAASFIPTPAQGPEGVVGDKVVEAQQASVTPIYGVAV